MNREEIENTKTGKLEDFNGNKNLLVSFGGMMQGLGIPVFEFFNSISDIPCDKIFLRDFHQAWYQKGVDDELDHIEKIIEYLKQIISQNEYKKVCFLGNSMGGYGAILFGNILQVDRVLAFAPQSFINRWHRLINGDRRCQEQAENMYSFKNKRVDFFDLKKYLKNNPPNKTILDIFYSPNHVLDKKHAERLKKIKNVVLHPIQKGGHEVVKTVRNNGQLKAIIKSTLV